MEQETLVRELYKACLERDNARERVLLRVETDMVLKHRAEGGAAFDTTWTVVTGTCGDVVEKPTAH
jgi:hypothetical protein